MPSRPRDFVDRNTGVKIDAVHGCPVENISCPGCGRKWGHHRTTVCKSCEECSSCCSCNEQNLIPALEMIEIAKETM